MNSISTSRMSCIERCLIAIKNGDVAGFDHGIEGVGDLTDMVSKGSLPESQRFAKLFGSNSPKSEVEMSLFTAIVSAMLHSNHSMTSGHNRKAILPLFVRKAPVIDPLSPAFVVNKKRSSQVHSHFDLMMAVNEVPLADFMQRASDAGLVKAKELSYQCLLDNVITKHLITSDHIQSNDTTVWEKFLVCATHKITPSDAVLNRPLKLLGLAHEPTKWCYPLDESLIGISQKIASKSRPGQVIGLPMLAYAAATRGAGVIVPKLLELELDVNESNPANGVTALHVAAARHNMDAVRHLLAAGADIGAQDKLGRWPAQWLALDNGKDVPAIRQAGHEFQALIDSTKAMTAISDMIKSHVNPACA